MGQVLISYINGQSNENLAQSLGINKKKVKGLIGSAVERISRPYFSLPR